MAYSKGRPCEPRKSRRAHRALNRAAGVTDRSEDRIEPTSRCLSTVGCDRMLFNGNETNDAPSISGATSTLSRPEPGKMASILIYG